MQWSQLQKRVEAMFATSIQGRVRFRTTGYRGMHDEHGRNWITVDGQEIVNVPDWFPWMLEQYVDQPGLPQPFADYVSLCSKGDLRHAMTCYLTMSIADILQSDVVFIRAIGMLDRRLGKRRLRELDVKGLHPLIQLFHQLRCEAEGLAANGYCEMAANLKLRHLVYPNTPTRAQRKEKSRQAGLDLLDSKKTRRSRSILSRIHRGELTKDELDTTIASEIHAGFEHTADGDALLAILQYIDAKSKLVKSAAHVRGVIELTRDTEEWIRPLEQWTPKSHSPNRQFSSLARHLWALYDVPLFMDKAWLQGDALQQAWFKHIGAGRNIQTANGLPVPLTKKMAHYFLESPSSYSIEAAFRWAQVIALGGDHRLADALRDTRLVQDFRDNEFWLSVIRFFVRNPMLDLAHVQPMVDYIWNQRYEPRVAFVEHGVAQELGPEQPNFTMRGRTVASLLRAVNRWHRQLGRETAGGRLQWQKSPFHDYKFVEGTKESQNMKVWRIHELLSSQELIAEGRRMRHCVASYANSCHKGVCSIWSMDVQTDEGVEPLVTIEVNNQKKQICQVRGRCNRLATEREKSVLGRWAQQEGLKAAYYS